MLHNNPFQQSYHLWATYWPYYDFFCIIMHNQIPPATKPIKNAEPSTNYNSKIRTTTSSTTAAKQELILSLNPESQPSLSINNGLLEDHLGPTWLHTCNNLICKTQWEVHSLNSKQENFEFHWTDIYIVKLSCIFCL